MSSGRGGRSWRDEEEEDSTAKKIGMVGAAAAGAAFLAWGISKLMSAPEETKPHSAGPSTGSYSFYPNSTARAYQYSGGESESDDDTPVEWKKPPPRSYKLNVDGSDSPQNGSAGAGCIIRDDGGLPVVAAAYRLNQVNVSVAEAEALKKGLELAKSLKYIRDLYVEGDSEDVILQVNGLRSVNRLLDDVIRDIRELKKSFRFCEIKHVYSDANKVADELAKTGAGLEFPNRERTWKGNHLLPLRVASLVEKDRVGI